MPRKRRRLPRPRVPLNIERYYVARLREFWRRIERISWKGLENLLDVWPSEFRGDMSDEEKERMLAHMRQLAEDLPPPPRYPEYRRRPETGATAHAPRIRPVDPLETRMLPPPNIVRVDRRSIQQILDWVYEASSRVIRIEDVIPVVDNVLRRTSSHVTNDIRRILRIQLRDTFDPSLINAFRTANIELIESGIWADRAVPRLRKLALLPQVSEVVEKAHATGLRVEDLRDQLKERFGVGESRADLIARDQVLKLNGQINRARQKEVGITHYEWSAVKDTRTRKRHKGLKGPYSWDSPPDPPGLHPGQDYQCRCVAIPVPPDWLVA